MNCPKCGNEMEQQGEPETTYSHKREPGKAFERILWWCQQDNIWASVETPKVPEPPSGDIIPAGRAGGL